LRWRYDTGGNGFGNNELQTYTKHPRNASLDGQGHLFITARREWMRGSDGYTRPFTSARIKTAKRFSFQYGTAEARIQVPHGVGFWPAFWALGDNVGSVGWPLCGELDIMENIGRQPTVMHATVHGGRSSGGQWLAGRAAVQRRPYARDYHTYGMVWGPTAIAMTLDGTPYMTVSRSDVAPGDIWNFDHSFFLVLNLAVGGDWPGVPKRSTHFPAIMAVDFVRVRG
jgi:beta-glucanase (GH16 family)